MRRVNRQVRRSGGTRQANELAALAGPLEPGLIPKAVLPADDDPHAIALASGREQLLPCAGLPGPADTQQQTKRRTPGSHPL